jgi:hypothetical protein
VDWTGALIKLLGSPRAGRPFPGHSAKVRATCLHPLSGQAGTRPHFQEPPHHCSSSSLSPNAPL